MSVAGGGVGRLGADDRHQPERRRPVPLSAPNVVVAAHRDFVSEWQPPDPGTFIGQAFIVFTVLFVLPALWIGLRTAARRGSPHHGRLTVMIALGARFLLVRR